MESPGPHESELSYHEEEHLLTEKRNVDKEMINRFLGDWSTTYNPRKENSCQCQSSRWLWIHIITLAIYTAIFLSSVLLGLSGKQCTICNGAEGHSESTVLQPAFKFHKRLVNYTTNTPFAEPSLPDVDKAWKNVLNNRKPTALCAQTVWRSHELRLEEQDVAAANLSTIQIADGSGGYIVTPHVYHLLHCLFNIYKYAHTDFYGEDPKGPEWMTNHTDHCVENLRQFVQCHAGGTGVTTFKWLPARKTPIPILALEEICIDWDFFDSWVQTRSIPIDDLIHQKNKHLLEHPTMGVLAYEDFF